MRLPVMEQIFIMCNYSPQLMGPLSNHQISCYNTTDTDTHICTRTHVHTHACVHTERHAETRTHTDMNRHKCTFTCTHIHMHMHTCTHITFKHSPVLHLVSSLLPSPEPASFLRLKCSWDCPWAPPQISLQGYPWIPFGGSVDAGRLRRRTFLFRTFKYWGQEWGRGSPCIHPVKAAQPGFSALLPCFGLKLSYPMLTGGSGS